MTDKLNLPEVTLLCVETQMHALAQRTLTDMAAKIDFAEIVIHTDKPELIPVASARYVTVPNWPEKIMCGSYCYSKAPASVNTSHMLFTEWDGAVRDTAKWNPAWLTYDYIGAPWPGRKGGQWEPRQGYTVGNGGFTLWSKKLMTCIADSGIPCATDIHIAIDYRDALVRLCDAKWAPESVAYQFAFEHGTDTQRGAPSFGTHDIFNWPLALPRNEVVERTKMLCANEYIVKRTPKLMLLGQRASYLREAIPGFASKMIEHRVGRPGVRA